MALPLHSTPVTFAAAVTAQLTKVTSLLRDLILHENQKPNPADLSGFLTSGTFRQEGARVFGYWPVTWTLLNNLLT